MPGSICCEPEGLEAKPEQSAPSSARDVGTACAQASQSRLLKWGCLDQRNMQQQQPKGMT